MRNLLVFVYVTTTVALMAIQGVVSQNTSDLVVDDVEEEATTASFAIKNMNAECPTIIHDFNPNIHKEKYTVGVFSSEGEEVVYELYGTVFAEYLTATAGKRFNPPVEFDLIPVTLTTLINLSNDEKVDFFFSSSAIMSCMASEKQAQALVTIVNRRSSRGHEYDLDMYGGVMFTLATNKEVNTMEDFTDRTIGAGGITAMGAGQTQFYEMVKAGMSYVADPKQVVFTADERLVVQGMIDGEFEIGFARTDQIERHIDDNTGEPVNPEIFKVINPQVHIMEDGTLFPFLSSTGLHPEWPVAALGHVSRDVSREVQEALLALKDHYTSLELGVDLRCDTTPEIADLAKKASTRGTFTAFRTARSYFEVRTKQEDAGFLQIDEDGERRCIRGDTLYDDIFCPEGYYKLTDEQFEQSCDLVGLPCKEGYTCYCKPCVRAFEVDVYQYVADDPSGTTAVTGCEKMSLCGLGEQTKDIAFRIVDNRKRDGANVAVKMHFGRDSNLLPVRKVEDEDHVYEFHWNNNQEGVGIMEIFVNDEQIPESPIRVQVAERQCDIDFPGQNMESDENGFCQCDDSTVLMYDKCISSTVFAVAISLISVMVLSIIAAWVVRYRNSKADQMWHVNVDELHFDDPVEVVGQGSFGVVVLAEYRGTKVAIKRATKGNQGKGGSKSKSKAGSIRGSIRGSTRGGSTSYANAGTADASVPVDTVDIEAPDLLSTDGKSEDGNGTTEGQLSNGTNQGTPSNQGEPDLAFLVQEFGRKQKGLGRWLTGGKTYDNHFKETILGSRGSGSFSTIGIKQMLFPCFDSKAKIRQEFTAEMRILSRLRHPCITTVMGAVVSAMHDPMIVLEYMEYGSLYDLLRNETMYLTGDMILQIARDVAQGLRYLHASRPPILHGDLKARNILVDSRFRAKLCDFGLSTKTGNIISGTPYWLAPEYLRGQSDYTEMCDIYSIGIILYEIYSRKSPYEGENFKEVLRKVCDRRTNKRPVVPTTCPSKMTDLMKKCWSPDPQFRPIARDLDTCLMDMSANDAEPLEGGEQDGKQRRRTGDMLYELFPKHIANALKAGQKVEPETHELVTIVFSDIVKFTDISREISPLKVSQMLDRLYLAFDKIARKHGIFKVETIGDSYMGVTNLMNDQDSTHVKRIAEFAIDMINEASDILIDEDEPEKGFINIRVGFHCGPVVSNVIGSLNPRYGLFGDTVNTASRMETNSARNRILCSDKAYKLLREQAPDILCHKRGKIQVKGKGDMMTYWVGDKLIKAKREHREEGKTIMFADYVQPLSSPKGMAKPSVVQSMGGGAAGGGATGTKSTGDGGDGCGATATTAATSSPTSSIASRYDFTGSIIPSKDHIEDDHLVPQEQAPQKPRTEPEGERLLIVM